MLRGETVLEEMTASADLWNLMATISEGSNNHPLSSVTESESVAKSLVDVLIWRVACHPDRVAFIFLRDGETGEDRLTYRELDQRAKAIAARIQEIGSGDGVLLLYPPGLEYVCAFVGCLYSRRVAIPLYPPRSNRRLHRIQSIRIDSKAGLAMSTTSIRGRVQEDFAEVPQLRSLCWISTDDIPDQVSRQWKAPQVSGSDLAFLQYTSGSTGDPKGVMLTHNNLLANEALIQSAFGVNERSTIVGWLPIYHDMGLIGNILQTIYSGSTCIFMAPENVLRRPFTWLNAISRYHASISGGPNFAYELCSQRISAEERESLDLSTWEVAFNGSEPIRPDTLSRFQSLFGPCGFRGDAFYPCYGLAEATLIVSGRIRGTQSVVKSFDPGQLKNNFAAQYPAAIEEGKKLVSSGKIPPTQKVVIVDPESGTPCEQRKIGEIWISGPSVAQGYWNRRQETAETFAAYLSDTGEGPFLRSGDLGFLDDDELFITGRLKDLIIIPG